MFVTPKFCISIVFSFSWELKWPQEKLKTILMQNFRVTNKEHYGMLWYFLEWSIGRVVHPYRRGQGSNPVLPWIFFRLSFRNCKSCVQYNCDDHRSSNSSLRSSHIWFSYIQNFKYIFFVHCHEEIFFSSQNTCKYTLW